MKRQPTPPDLSDDELTALFALTPAEIEDAKSMWRADAPRGGKPLLDAPEHEGEDGG